LKLFVNGPQGQSIAMFFERENFPGWENAHVAAVAPELVTALVALLSAPGFAQFEVAADNAFALLDSLGVKS
jgi:hypothetical protein